MNIIHHLFVTSVVYLCFNAVSGSKDRLDACLVCAGRNNSCTVISGIFTRHTLPLGYNLVATIPKGSCNITITELKPSSNLLALRIAPINRYVINGNWVKTPTGRYRGAGTTFYYRKSESRGDVSTPQLVTARGPLTRDVNLMIIYREKNSGVKYEYLKRLNQTKLISSPEKKVNDQRNLRLASANKYRKSKKKKHHRHSKHNDWRRQQTLQNKSVKEPSIGYFKRPRAGRNRVVNSNYVWKVIGLTECSAPCGSGVQNSIVSCAEVDTDESAPESYCRNTRKTKIESIPCNTKPCHAKWELKRWSPCSVTCGKGIQTREVSCKQRLSSTLNMMVPEGACSVITPKPKSRKVCFKSCNKWKISRWTACSSTCGSGLRSRSVSCVDHSGRKIPFDRCSLNTKPVEQESCEVKPCSNMWIQSSWEYKCSSGCGFGVQERHVFCWSSDKIIPDDKCDPLSRPSSSKSCSSFIECEAKWFAGPWSECSSECGPGTRTREMMCIRKNDEIMDKEICSRQASQPPTLEKCEIKPCLSEWHTSPWSSCTKSCGGGVQTRIVTCLNLRREKAENCEEKYKPDSIQDCNKTKCPELPKDETCLDEYNHCDLVIRARLCKYDFYKDKCCDSCRSY